MAVERRERVNLTLDPTWRERADRMARVRGLSLSTFLEQLVRAEYEREREQKAVRRG